MNRKVALVTGGASGIGEAIAAALSSRGHVVVVADIDAESARATAAELAARASASGGEVHAAGLDVTDRAAFSVVAQQVRADHGRIDLLFNNAGIGVGGLADEMTSAHWDRTIDVNLRGVVHGVQAVLPIMQEQREGHIVNTASMAGLITAPLMLPYTTTKHAVVALSRALRAEVRDDGVRVSAVCPAFIATPLLQNINPGMEATDASRDTEATVRRFQPHLPSAAELAEEVLRGVARNSTLIVFPRSQWAVVATMRLAPWLVERVTRTVIVRYRRDRTAP